MLNRIKNNEQAFFFLLAVLDELFKKHDIDYWLDCGSLLGAIREGTYISWDKDMDVSIHFKDAKRVIKLKEEFAEYDVFLGNTISLRIIPKFLDNVSICIFPLHTIRKNKKQYLIRCGYPLFYWTNHITHKILPKMNLILEKCKLYIYMCSKIKLLRVIHSPLEYLGNFAYISFCGTVCPIPEFPDEYLTYTFGDWRTVHKFDSHQDINNMYYSRTLNEVEK